VNNTFGVELAGRTWRLATGTLHLLGDWRKVSGSACVRAVVISHAKVQAQRIVEQLRAARSLDRPPPCHTLNQSSTHLFGHPAGGRYPFSWTSAFPRLDFLFAFEWGRLRQMGEWANALRAACFFLSAGKAADLQVCLLLIAPNCGGDSAHSARNEWP